MCLFLRSIFPARRPYALFIQLTVPVTQSDHKALHKIASGKTTNGILDRIRTPKVVSKPDPATGLYNPFPSFAYTGPLRPVYPLSEKRTVPKDIPHPDYAETGYPKSEMYLNRNKFDILDEKGQEAMRTVCRIGREVLDITAAEIRPGVTTDYLDEVCHKATIERKVRRDLFPDEYDPPQDMLTLSSRTLHL